MAISGSTAPVPRWYRLDSRRGFLVSGSTEVGVAVGSVVLLMCGSTAATTALSAAQWPSSLFLLPVLVVGIVRCPSGSTARPSGSTAAANGSTAGSSASAAHTALPRTLFRSALRVLPPGR